MTQPVPSVARPAEAAVPPSAGHPSPGRQPGGTILVLIGIFKLAKALLFFLLGLIALHLVHRNLAELILHSARFLHADTKGKWVNYFLSHALLLSPGRLVALGVGLFTYSALFLTEGIGLVLRQHWAEYFTTITTGLFIPLEFYEIFHHFDERHHFSAPEIYLTAINVIIVIYLIARLRREHLAARARAA